jgi:hypothetical protein
MAHEPDTACPKPVMTNAWIADCRKWRGKVLTGTYRHWCQEWDGLPVDETTMEWPCGCFEACDGEYADGER